MALVPTVGTPQDIDAATTHVWAFDAGTSPKAIVVAIARASTSDTSSVDYGGKTLTKWAQGEWSVGGHNAGEVWGYIGSDVPSGSNDVTVVTAAAVFRVAVPIAFTAAGPITLGSPVYAKSTASGQVRFTMDSGTDPGVGIVAGSVRSGSDSPIAGTTADVTRLEPDKAMSVGHETAPGTGSRAVGFSAIWLCGAAGVMLLEADIDVTPDPWGMGLGFNAGVAAVGADRVVPGARMRALALGFRSGLVEAQADRQVMLTGNDLETPEMTEGGVEGDVLTRHIGRPPTWETGGGEESGRWVPMTIDPAADGAWQLLFTDGGDVMMMRVVDEDIWDAQGDLITAGAGGLGAMGLGEEGLGE